MRALAGALLAFFVFSAPAQAQTYDDVQILQIEHGGGNRLFGLYVPRSYSASRPAPLIIAFHRSFSSANALHAASGLQAIAEARGAILVYPEPARYYWDDGGHALLPYRRETAADDIGFINELIGAVAHDYAVDRARVYAVGHDDGGAMAYRLICDARTPLAGVAVVNAPMSEFMRTACTSARPAPLLIMQGRRSQVLPFEGDPRSEGDTRRLSATDTLAFFRRAYGCDSPTQRGRGISGLYSSCTSGASLAFVSVERGGNDWFRDQPSQTLNRHNVDATRLLDQFFFQSPTALTFPDERTGGPEARSAIVYVPPTYDPARPTPVVMMLHGRPGTAAGMASMTEMNLVARRHGFIVVYPDGVDYEWNSTGDLFERDNPMSRDMPMSRRDDVGFLRQLASELRLNLNVDPRRIYLTGFSNGAIMTARTACSAPDTFAAFAVVGGAFQSIFRDPCAGSTPRPIMFMHGTADSSVGYEGVFLPGGQDGVPTRIAPSIPDAVQYWANHNGCGQTGVRTDFVQRGQSPGTNVSRIVLAENCTNNAVVSFYAINGGGHNWPGVPSLVGSDFAGQTNMDINAGEELWSFFKDHELTPSR